MRRPISGMYAVLGVAALTIAVGGLSPVAFGQNNGNNNNNGVAGILVNPDGVVQTRVIADPTGMLRRQQIAAARASLNADVAKPSALRMVSLPRLERAIIEANGALTDDMKYLAGLQRIKYVFVYPESGDIVIAGPAEGWMTDPAGRVVGLTTGRPVLRLEDLVVALRAYSPNGDSTRLISCSIDPTQEGLARMQQFLAGVGRILPPGGEYQAAQYIAANLRESLGPQEITIQGVPADTHFAQVLVEADYRMKLIGIGLEKPPVRMTTYIDRASGAQPANALMRWYFVPDYQCLRVSDDGNGMELVGDGVKLVGANEVVEQDGVRRVAGNESPASKAYTVSFTRNYSQLAARSPVYAELRNLIDMAVVAAYLQKNDVYSKTGWKMEFLGDESQFKVRLYPAPKKVATAVNAVFKGSRLLTPVGGGVHIEPDEALKPENLLNDEEGKLAKMHKDLEINLPEGKWWWD